MNCKTLCKACSVTGLTRWKSNPASRERRRSSVGRSTGVGFLLLYFPLKSGSGRAGLTQVGSTPERVENFP